MPTATPALIRLSPEQLQSLKNRQFRSYRRYTDMGIYKIEYYTNEFIASLLTYASRHDNCLTPRQYAAAFPGASVSAPAA